MLAKTRAAGVLIAALAGCLAACQGSTSASANKTPHATSTSAQLLHVRGSFTLTDSDAIGVGGGDPPICFGGVPGYDDIKSGAFVTVRNSTGKIIATGQLADPMSQGSQSCRFDWSVAVPPSDFYTVEVTHRGQVTFTRQQMLDGPALSLGS